MRVTVTGFLLFVAFGTVTNLALLSWKTGFTPTGFSHYYRGFEPPLLSDAETRYPKEFRELLENAHFHVYIVPVVLLVLTHLFFMTPWSERTKVGITALAYGAALADLVAPWLVRYGGEAFAWWKTLSSLTNHAALLFLLGVCFYETWLRRIPSAPIDGAPEPADWELG
jgi:hypothetical protein